MITAYIVVAVVFLVGLVMILYKLWQEHRALKKYDAMMEEIVKEQMEEWRKRQ